MKDELYHYGVLGMKWGIRKDPTAAYEKSSAHLGKLYSKWEKYNSKAGKRYEKAERKMKNPFNNRLEKEAKGKRGIRKADKSNKKREKLAKQGAKFYKTMEKEFGKLNIAMKANDIKVGERFVNANSNRGNVNSAKLRYETIKAKNDYISRREVFYKNEKRNNKG